MNPTELYLFLFTDSLVSGLVLPAKQALVLPALRIFGGYNDYIISLIYTLGVTFAAAINWGFGKILRSLKKDTAETLQHHPFIYKILGLLQKYGYMLGAAGFIPTFGAFLLVLSGICKVNPFKTIGLVFITNLIFYTFLHMG